METIRKHHARRAPIIPPWDNNLAIWMAVVNSPLFGFKYLG